LLVLGVDAYRKGWIAVALASGTFAGWTAAHSFQELLDASRDAVAVGVDIPIGLPHEPRRDADRAAAQFLGTRASVVFSTLPREIYDQPTRAEADRLSRLRGWGGVNVQSYGLGRRILEVEAAMDARTFEVHPEVTFHALAGRALPPKHTWDGFMTRRRLLASAGIELPDELGGAPLIDTLDAAAAAWSADRFARGLARPLPEDARDRVGTIWY
jgi:predicted RNase H-like nuclease